MLNLDKSIKNCKVSGIFCLIYGVLNLIPLLYLFIISLVLNDVNNKVDDSSIGTFISVVSYVIMLVIVVIIILLFIISAIYISLFIFSLLSIKKRSYKSLKINGVVKLSLTIINLLFYIIVFFNYIVDPILVIVLFLLLNILFLCLVLYFTYKQLINLK